MRYVIACKCQYDITYHIIFRIALQQQRTAAAATTAAAAPPVAKRQRPGAQCSSVTGTPREPEGRGGARPLHISRMLCSYRNPARFSMAPLSLHFGLVPTMLAVTGLVARIHRLDHHNVNVGITYRASSKKMRHDGLPRWGAAWFSRGMLYGFISSFVV
jgi:hypothetical protein